MSIGDRFKAAKDYWSAPHQAYKADAEYAQAMDRGDEKGAEEADNRFNQAVNNVEDAKDRFWGK